MIPTKSGDIDPEETHAQTQQKRLQASLRRQVTIQCNKADELIQGQLVLESQSVIKTLKHLSDKLNSVSETCLSLIEDDTELDSEIQRDLEYVNKMARVELLLEQLVIPL